MSAAAPPSIGRTPTTTTTHTPSLSSLKAAADGNPPPSLSSSSSTLLAAPPLARLSTPATATTTTTAAPAAQYHYYHAPPSSSSVAATAASSSSSSSSLYSFSSPSSPTSMALSFPPLHGSSAAVAPVRAHIVALNKEIGRLRRRGDPSFADVQALAERTWRANLEYEAAVARLDREKAQLNRLIDSTWIQFDTLIRPLWRIDDTLVPAYDALAGILTSLEDLANRQKAATDDYLRTDKVAVEDLSFEVRDLEQELWRLQDALHAVENRHVVEGRFYSAEAAAAWKGARNSITNGAVAAADEVPGGQALLSNLLARCHRLVRKIQEAEVSVHPSLYSTQIRLENIVAALRAFRAALASPGRDGAENDDDDDAVDPADLRDLQARLDAVDAARVDGKFVAAGLGATAAAVVVEGQAILSELLNEGYDLVHECLVELETRRAPDRPRTATTTTAAAAATTTADASTAAAPSNSSSVLLAVTDRVAAVRDALLGLAFVTGDRRTARAAATSATASATAAPAEEEAEEEEEDDALAVGGRRAFTFRQRVPQDKDDGGKPVPTGGSDAAASAPAKPGYADLLGTGPALHSLADTLFAGFTALRGTLAGGAAATTTTIAAATSAAPAARDGKRRRRRRRQRKG
ncbi:hypothetical protein DFJ73DRAFT_52276 [Zopfochytrium polystomum]|nr:hypothetical protein DFJ73DRAFT_52276 [Zopfochytrium polystomum]